VCILHAHGRNVARRWAGRGGRLEWYWTLDGRRVSLAELEDQADEYEPNRYRHTPRGGSS
jgi:hypothetical protein